MLTANKYFLVIIFFFCVSGIHAQIKGRVLSDDGLPIQSATIFIQNNYAATTTNAYGDFEFRDIKLDSCTITIQNLGYRTQKVKWHSNNNKFLTIQLEKIDLEIEAVIIQQKHNPADRIIKNAIANRVKNGKLNDKFEADFYAKGSMILDKLPKRILGKKIDSAEIAKETAGSNFLYLSETISKVKMEKPNKIHEQILASKVSGDNNGLSLNRAEGTEFDLYANYLDIINNKVISPIADQAFQYYTYQLISSMEEEGQTIHKIKVIPKRSAEPVIEGYLYIVDDSWQIFGADILTLGNRINVPIIDTLEIKQQYTFHQHDNRWVKQQQTLKLKAGVLGIGLIGNFTYVFSNYNFHPQFDKNTFSKITTEFDDAATHKKDDFWANQRQVPLTNKETKDYFVKDSIAVIRNSPAYIDSVDRAESKFKITDILTSYHYQNTPKQIYLTYNAPLSLERISFNTVQGWNIKANLTARFGSIDSSQYSRASVSFNYGFADKKLYTVGQFYHRFNKTTYAQLSVTGGNSVKQFNDNVPITPFINTWYSLILKDNYMKLYSSQFVNTYYSQYLNPNLKIAANLAYQYRSNLYNNTDFSIFDKNKSYTSNNPLDPYNKNTASFTNNEIVTGKISLELYFKTRIEKLPKALVYKHDDQYPKITINYTNALYSNQKNYTFQELNTAISQNISIGNKGQLAYNATFGTFFDGSDISFIDYKHFNGNRTGIVTSNRYLQSYLLLPYYANSTNKSYAEVHTEYNFKGYLWNKIPLVNRLNLNTIVGYHLLATADKKPYHEFTVGLGNLGWGKYRFFRVDFVHTRNGQFNQNGVTVGLLNVFR